MYTGGGTASKQYYHADIRGSIVAMSNASGALIESYSYSAFGEAAVASGNPCRYTGRRIDPVHVSHRSGLPVLVHRQPLSPLSYSGRISRGKQMCERFRTSSSRTYAELPLDLHPAGAGLLGLMRNETQYRGYFRTARHSGAGSGTGSAARFYRQCPSRPCRELRRAAGWSPHSRAHRRPRAGSPSRRPG